MMGVWGTRAWPTKELSPGKGSHPVTLRFPLDKPWIQGAGQGCRVQRTHPHVCES